MCDHVEDIINIAILKIFKNECIFNASFWYTPVSCYMY